MSHANGQNGQRTLQPLRGKRPPNVEGRMRRRHLIDALDRWADEDAENPEEAEESWNTVKESLRNVS
jgi:hypothetical protein